MRNRIQRYIRLAGIFWVAFNGASCMQGQGQSEFAQERRPTLPAVSRFELNRENPAFQVTEKGPHHQVWKRVETFTNSAGVEEERISSYTELAGGLNYWDEETGNWSESKALVEPFRGGAVARQGRTKVVFSPRLGDANGTVEIQTEGGQRLRSVVLGLAYYDPVTGEDIVLSEVNPNVRGVIVPPNKVVYRDAFTDIQADIIYEYQKSVFSQNVVLREQPPDPALAGLSNSTRLEVLSEFLEAPEPVKNSRVIRPVAETGTGRQAAAAPDLVDESLAFGDVRIGDGWAFKLSGSLDQLSEARPFDLSRGPQERGDVVVKEWQTVEGRQVLIEGVEYSKAKPKWTDLPLRADLLNNGRASRGERLNSDRSVPARQIAQKVNEQNPLPIENSSNFEIEGYLIDYQLISGALTDFVFETGKTYLVENSISLSGMTIFEGGSVIKFGGSFSQLNIGSNPVEFRTSPFQPCIMTSSIDDSVGVRIDPGNTLDPANEPYQYSFALFMTDQGQLIENVVIKHLYVRFWIQNDLDVGEQTLRNVRFDHVEYPLFVWGGRDVRVQNVLMEEMTTGLYYWPRSSQSPPIDKGIHATNVTMNDVVDVVYNSNNVTYPIVIENSIIIDYTNLNSFVGSGASHNIILPSGAGVFQSVGGGNYYLANNSPYRNAGTNEIDPELRYQLERMTTYPPTELPNPTTLTVDTVWNKHIPRDDDGSIDIGYHYAAMDYLFEEVNIEASTELRVNNGTVCALHGDSVGLWLNDGAHLELVGTTEEAIVYTRHENVQESLVPQQWQWSAFLGTANWGGGAKFTIRVENTNFYAGLKSNRFLNNMSFWYGEIESLDIFHSKFFGGHMNTYDEITSSHRFRNNLFHRVNISIAHHHQFELFNNLFYGGEVGLSQDPGASLWEIENNIFHESDDGPVLGIPNAVIGHNAYVNTSFRINGVTQMRLTRFVGEGLCGSS